MPRNMRDAPKIKVVTPRSAEGLQASYSGPPNHGQHRVFPSSYDRTHVPCILDTTPGRADLRRFMKVNRFLDVEEAKKLTARLQLQV